MRFIGFGLTIAATTTVIAVGSTAVGQSERAVAPIEVDPAMAELGKRLFFDPRLSGDATLSCASCHVPELGFSDGLALSEAYAGSLHFRNTPTLINTAHRDAWMHDGRLGTNLNDVTREMLTETYLMNMDMRMMQERVRQDPVYVEMFAAAGLGTPSNGGVRNAIPAYLSTLISRGAPYDTGDLTEEAARGEALFFGDAGCSACHTGDRFTDDQPHVTGVPDNPDIWAEPLRHIGFITYAKFMGVANYMNLRADPGAYVRGHEADGSTFGSFMTPTLRELTYTGPYMHNGVFETLYEVVAFYNDGGGDVPNRDPRLQPLGLSAGQRSDLVAFLEALSGEPLTGPEFVWEEEIPYDYPAIENWRETEN